MDGNAATGSGSRGRCPGAGVKHFVALLDTLVAVLLGVVMLGERVDSSLLLGGALILSSAALANFSPSAPSPSSATPESPPSEPVVPSPRKAA